MKFAKRLILISILFTSCAFADSRNYVPGISDLPVPLNFHLKNDTSSVFYNDSGRIVEAVFQGQARGDEIKEFYNVTLKALGWERVGVLKYVREKELLEITTKSIDDDQFNTLEVNFSLKPNN
ncbi:MAG: hypothetical protein HOM96_01835 [Rickettsiales bacterium]|jgi:hypothetical protein|nr:hypothetical protein [Rickettsiales bacterium]